MPIAVRAPPPLKARTARWTPLTMSATAAGQLGELIGGVGVACGRHGREVPARVRELDLGLGREGGVQHGPLIGQKWAEV